LRYRPIEKEFDPHAAERRSLYRKTKCLGVHPLGTDDKVQLYSGKQLTAA